MSVSGAVADKPATGVTTDVAIVVRADSTEPAYVSRGGHKLAGALEAFAPARSGRRGTAVPGRRRLDRGLHRRAAAGRGGRGRRRRRRLRPAGVVPAHRRPGGGRRPHQRPRHRPRAGRRAGRPGGRRPLLHLVAARAGRAHRRHASRRRPRAHGQAPVRGRQGASRQGRGGPGPGPARGGGDRRGRRRRGAGVGRRGGGPQPPARPVGQRRVLPLAAPRPCLAHRGRRRGRRGQLTTGVRPGTGGTGDDGDTATPTSEPPLSSRDERVGP